MLAIASWPSKWFQLTTWSYLIVLMGSAILITPIISLARSAQLGRISYEGFGSQTLGGQGKPTYYVTNLNDSGPGSLRDALSQGERYVSFKVAGEILLQSRLYVQGANITIDGFTAASPAITLRNYGLFIHGTKGSHDLVVRGIRIRDTLPGRDGIQIAHGAYNVVIDHVSIQGGGDGNLDISNSRDVTVSWSIFAKPAGTQKNMLIKYHPSRITLHHNMFLSARQRNPQVRIDDAGTSATETTVDMRTNLVWGWERGYGSLIWHGPWVNVVNNFYSSGGGDPKQALVVSHGARAYVTGNLSNDGLADYINGRGTEPKPFPARPVGTTDACTAAHQVLSDAGVKPRDSVDQQYLSAVSLPACSESEKSAPLVGSTLSIGR
jgi:pectate lyase